MPTALRLGLAMVVLQASIGTLNDLIDAERDAGRVPSKPIPSGGVSVGIARAVWLGSAGLGLLLVVPSGLPTLLLAAVGLGIGYAYDRFAKGTAWSWLPFAVGIPLLPVFAWVGTGVPLPPAFALLVPCAVLAGTALAIANASADLETDVASGATSIAARLGLTRAWLVQAALLVVVLLVVVGSVVRVGAAPAPMALASMGVVLVIAGLVWGTPLGGRRPDPRQRERAWELEAIGVGVAAVGWLLGIGLA